MKKLLIASIFLNISVLALTQTSSDPDAKAILDAVSAKFKTFKTVNAKFSYKVENGEGKALSSKTGSIIMKGVKYKISFGGQEIFSDGAKVWNYDKSTNEVSISSVDESSGMITPTKLFSDFYNKDFLYKLNGETKIGTKVLQEIEMTPVDKSKTFHKVYLQVDKKGKTIYSTKVLEKGGNRYTYTVSSMTVNTTIADTQFVFDKSKYPNVEVVELP